MIEVIQSLDYNIFYFFKKKIKENENENDIVFFLFGESRRDSEKDFVPEICENKNNRTGCGFFSNTK